VLRGQLPNSGTTPESSWSNRGSRLAAMRSKRSGGVAVARIRPHGRSPSSGKGQSDRRTRHSRVGAALARTSTRLVFPTPVSPSIQRQWARPSETRSINFVMLASAAARTVREGRSQGSRWRSRPDDVTPTSLPPPRRRMNRRRRSCLSVPLREGGEVVQIRHRADLHPFVFSRKEAPETGQTDHHGIVGAKGRGRVGDFDA